jgi:hypothetical protein
MNVYVYLYPSNFFIIKNEVTSEMSVYVYFYSSHFLIIKNKVTSEISVYVYLYPSHFLTEPIPKLHLISLLLLASQL